MRGRTATVSDGRFHFGGVGAGKFKINVSLKGFTPASYAGVLGAGEVFEVPAIKMDMPSMTTSVEVVASEEDLAQAEIKVAGASAAGGNYAKLLCQLRLACGGADLASEV